jgi:alkanesulfonate monooxygenase SsuD/methylene tetrahydromethanopterin reductase-like flavin-dependent oxidoreductase (luciferase family)
LHNFGIHQTAGEIAMSDLIMDGRLDLGIARGAYTYEYERFDPELNAWQPGQKIIPTVQKL